MAVLVKSAGKRKLARWQAFVTLLVAAAAITGCATVYEGRYAFKDGWRRATVVSVVPGALLERPGYWRCARKLSLADRAAKTYAVVWYVSGRTKSYFAVDAPDTDVVLGAGTRVYVNVFDCAQPPVLRVADARGAS